MQLVPGHYCADKNESNEVEKHLDGVVERIVPGFNLRMV
jgi:hypothetical protein